MAAAAVTTHDNRELLSQRILEILDSWPEIHRQIFIRAHYWGDTPDMISGAMGLVPAKVQTILDQCERWLYAELRPLRRDTCSPDPDGPFRGKVMLCQSISAR